MYKKIHACISFFIHQSSPSTVSKSHWAYFIFLFLDQANSISVKGKSYCLFKLEFLPYLFYCLGELMEFGFLFCLLSFPGIFLLKVSLPDKMLIFSDWP